MSHPRPWQFDVATLGGYGRLNCFSGNHVVSVPVVSWGGKGGGLDLTLFHNSAATFNLGFPMPTPPISRGWSHSFHVYLQGAGTTSVTVVEGDGAKNTFTQNVNGSFTAPSGVWDTLTLNGNGTYTLTRKYGTRFNFGTNHKLATIVDRNSNTTTVQYGGSGQVSQVTDAASRSLTFSYSGSGLLQTITDPLSRQFSLTYDTANHLRRVTFPAPATGQAQPYFEVVAVGALGTMSSFRNRRGSTWSLAYTTSDLQRPQTIMNPNTHTLTLSPTFAMVTLEDGTNRTWAQDANGNRTSVSLNGNPTYPAETQSWTWDAQRNMLTRVTGTGGTWEYTYDASGNVLTVEDPITRSNPSVTFQVTTYNSDNLPTSTWDALNHRTDFYYDTAGNLTRQVDPLLYETLHTYSTAGLRLTTTDQRNKVWEWQYDTYGNATLSKDPLLNQSTATFNALGWVTSTTDATSVLETVSYDNLGRPKRLTHSDSTYMELTYDGEDSVLTARDENGRVTTNVVNSLGWVTSTTDALTRTTSYTYNNTGHRLTLTNARNKTTTWTLDNAGRPVRTDYPDSTYEEVTYNADGEVATRTDGRGNVVTNTYDAVSRLTDVDYPTGPDTNIQYLANGLRSSLTDRSGTYSWTYSARGEVLQETSPQATLTYTYYANGRRLSLSRSGAGTTSYALDDASRMTSLTNGLSETTAFTHDAAGRTTLQTHANGTKVVNTYDAVRGWLDTLEHRQSNNTTLARYDYTRDATGRITEESQPGDHLTVYAFDAAYQLTAETRTGTLAHAATYTYDVAGNRLTKTVGGTTESYTYGDNNQLLTAGGKTYAYDNNGNLLTVTTGGLTTTLAWDYNDKLTGISYPGGATNSFVTNDLGFRVTKTDSGGTQSYVRDGATVLADGRAHYTTGGLGGLISEHAGGASKAYHGDHLGSTRGLTDGTQAVTDSRERDAFGLTVGSTGTTPTPFGFVGGQGYQSDADSGLMLLGARYYDPSVGRFINRDPIRYRGGLNLYGYCSNDPLNSIDPDGHQAAAINLLYGAGGAALGDGPLPFGDIIAIGLLAAAAAAGIADLISMAKKTKQSEKEKSSDIPSWAEGQRPAPGESGKEFARRLINEKYPNGPPKGSREESQLKKYGDRHQHGQ